MLPLLVGAPSEEPSWLFTLALRSRPAGGLVGGEALFPLAGDLSLGAYLNYFFYWGEMGAKAEWRYLDGFLVAGLWAGVEPGEFIRSDTSGDGRDPGLRGVARLRLELNYRIAWLWLYNRATAEGRVRTFEERDPYRDAILGSELSFEEAFAPLIRVFSWSERSAAWLYAELTVAGEVRFGLLDLRPSAGVIVEDVLPGVTFDLDLYYSLRKASAVGGFGALFLVWWRI